MVTFSKATTGWARQPESGYENAKMKSRVAAFSETKPRSDFAKSTNSIYF